MIEMYHDVSYGQWYLWMCTTHIQPPHVQYVEWNDACTILYIHTSSFVPDICQDARAKFFKTELAISKLYGHLIYGQPDSLFFFHWNSLPSWTELQKEPSNRLILCWGRHFTWKQHLGNTFLWEAPFQMPGDSLSWKISGVSAFQLFQEFEVFHVVSQRDTAKWGHPQTLRIWKC